MIYIEDSGRISIWNLATRQTEFTYDAIMDLSEPGWLAATTDCSCLALPTTSDQAHLWLFDRTTREAVYLDKVQANEFEGMAFSPDGTLLATLVSSKRSTWVRLYDVLNHKDLGDLEPGNQFLGTERPQPLAFSPDSDFLVAADIDGGLFLWNVHERRFIASFAAHPEPGRRQIYSIRAVAWSPSRNCLATGGWDLNNESADEFGEFQVKLWSFHM